MCARWLGSVAVSALLCAQAEAQTFQAFPPGAFDNIAALAGRSTPSCTGGSVSDLNFATQTYCGDVSPPLTVSRASAETCVDSTGAVVTYAANNQACITSAGWGSTWPASSNVALNSNAFASWTALGSSTVTDLGVGSAPDGVAHAYTITIGSGAEGVRDQSAAITVGANYDLSVWARYSASGGASCFRMTTNDTLAWNTGISASFVLTASWVRYNTAGIVASAGAGSNYFIIGNMTVSGGDGACSGKIDIAFSQEEPGTVMTPYIPAAGVTAARAADNVSVKTSWLLTAINSGVGSLVVNTNNGQAAQTATLFDSNGTTLLGETSANKANTAVGTSLVSSNTATWTGLVDVGLAWDGSGGDLDLAGTKTTDSTARTPSATEYFGSTGGASNFCECNITRVTAYQTKIATPQ